MYNFDTFFLACYVHGFCTILGTKNHISLDIKILRRSYKIIHGEKLDIGPGNILNPIWSSKCTIFMTGFFTKGLFSIPGEMLNFKSCLARKAKIIIAKQRTYLQCTIETISVSIYKTVMKNFGVKSSLSFLAAIFVYVPNRT